MRFQLATTLVALLTTSILAQDAGVSSIVSELDSIKSEMYALTTATGSDAAVSATSLGSVLGSFIASVSTNSDWPAASSILLSQAATESAKLSSTRSSITSSANSASKSGSSSQSVAAAGATSSGLAPMVTAGISGMMAMGVLGAAILL
jgi:hypothetical protein